MLKLFTYKKLIKNKIFIICMLFLFSGMANAQLPQAKHYNGIPYITGGFGLEESTAIKDAMPEYALVFTFASSDKGRAVYVSKVQLVIRDANDFTIFNAESDGPFLLAQIPAGNYIVHATYKNKTLSRKVNVVANKSNRAVFDWPFQHETDIKPVEQSSQAIEQPTDNNKPAVPSGGFIPGLGVNPRGQ